MVPTIFVPSFNFSSSARAGHTNSSAAGNAANRATDAISARNRALRLTHLSIALPRPCGNSPRHGVAGLVSRECRYGGSEAKIDLRGEGEEGLEGFAEQRAIFRAIVAIKTFPERIGADAVVRHI